MNEIANINTNDYTAMAKAMGMVWIQELIKIRQMP